MTTDPRRLSDSELCDVVVRRVGGQWLGSDIVELVGRFTKARHRADLRLLEVRKLQACILRKNAELANLRQRFEHLRAGVD